VGGQQVAVCTADTVIVGAGAAGMNCAVKLVEFWRGRGVGPAEDRVVVVTAGLGLGASRMSGSDKQTYYKMGTSPRVPDTAEDFARTLCAFGCCNGDTALVEGIGSLRGFYHLVEVGVPFPHDPSGAFIGYKTDHDPYERATSAGPKTSKFMSECLQAKLERFGVRIFDRHPVVQFLTAGAGERKRIVGMLCIDRSRAGGADLGLSAFAAKNWVLAAGGPGEIYATTVYPRGQYGLHGPALEAGLEACNLTESQYGLASIQFRWNVSGTYMQVVPRIFSTDADGRDPREFLTEYFDDMPTMATSIFLKGYQWPFDAQRIVDHQSSLIDMAVHQETVVRGRRVWMDFLRNPVGAEGWDEFAIDALGAEALEYLRKTGALQATPIERLRHMNPPAIEIYAEHGIDLAAEPLEIAVCAQHMNGGFAVNTWWESNVPHTFVVGEMAGTHGVKRPGGSALNAGQVGAARAAEYIANVYGCDEPDLPTPIGPAAEGLQDALREAIGRLRDTLSKAATAQTTVDEAQAEIAQRMTRWAAHLRSRAGAAEALQAAKRQCQRLESQGLKVAGAAELADAERVRQQCLTQIALLKAICGMFDRGAGSRGSHCILDDDGIEMHPALIDPATGRPYRFKPENEALRSEILHLTYNRQAPDLFDLRVAAPRPIPTRDIAFEPAWTEFREGRIYGI
jgi:succinate dehydrogenase/fumarate reductase flavoprotein subunit